MPVQRLLLRKSPSWRQIAVLANHALAKRLNAATLPSSPFVERFGVGALANRQPLIAVSHR